MVIRQREGYEITVARLFASPWLPQPTSNNKQSAVATRTDLADEEPVLKQAEELGSRAFTELEFQGGKACRAANISSKVEFFFYDPSSLTNANHRHAGFGGDAAESGRAAARQRRLRRRGADTVSGGGHSGRPGLISRGAGVPGVSWAAACDGR
ncbi:hypothetical protein AAFF_G00370150 [Aldrovandia affinis]|uniref:Uncharacterized protein n=1 Tax=Aldrovandia affinis TaxID=143900 RepID=A0AAD7WMH4_9TELE|nr:hypothetical protein AAFF_G00370150 [Aldrovandia affinis]